MNDQWVVASGRSEIIDAMARELSNGDGDAFQEHRDALVDILGSGRYNADLEITLTIRKHQREDLFLLVVKDGMIVSDHAVIGEILRNVVKAIFRSPVASVE